MGGGGDGAHWGNWGILESLGDGEWGWGEGGLLFAMFNFRADREKQKGKTVKKQKNEGQENNQHEFALSEGIQYTVERGGSEVIGSEWGRLPNTYQSPTVSCFLEGDGGQVKSAILRKPLQCLK